MDATMAAALRKPFPPEQIGHLPRSGIQLDYVGHADVTSRLIEVDPDWSWEPLGTDDHGLPVFDLDAQGKPVGLWIRLTIGDVTRLGYGSVPSSQNDAVKVLIGDALRNAAMRFGVAVDLWAKGDRSDPSAENPSGPAGQAQRSKPAPRAQPNDPLTQTRVELMQTAVQAGLGSDPATVGQHFESAIGKTVPEASLEDVQRFIGIMREDIKSRGEQMAPA